MNWIDMDEKEPPIATRLLVCFNGETVIGSISWEYDHEDEYSYYIWVLENCNKDIYVDYGEINHWMPLPAPPSNN